MVISIHLGDSNLLIRFTKMIRLVTLSVSYNLTPVGGASVVVFSLYYLDIDSFT